MSELQNTWDMANEVADEICNKGLLTYASHVRGLAKLGKSLEQDRDQLQRQNDELQDRIVKLEVAASMDMRDLEQYGDLRMDRLREYFGNPTGQQRLTESLKHIEAAAIDEYHSRLSQFMIENYNGIYGVMSGVHEFKKHYWDNYK